MQTVTLLHASLPADGVWHWQATLLQALPYAKRLEFERRKPEDLRAALGGLALLVLGARRLRPSGIAVRQLEFAPDRKPRCAGGPYFSISHTLGRVACVVSAGIDPGVDIEHVPATTTATERARLLRWTATEAALKAAGLGLREAGGVQLDAALRHTQVGALRLVLQELRLAAGCIGHLAAADLPATLQVCAVNLDAAEVSAAVECSLGFPSQGD